MMRWTTLVTLPFSGLSAATFLYFGPSLIGYLILALSISLMICAMLLWKDKRITSSYLGLIFISAILCLTRTAAPFLINAPINYTAIITFLLLALSFISARKHKALLKQVVSNTFFIASTAFAIIAMVTLNSVYIVETLSSRLYLVGLMLTLFLTLQGLTMYYSRKFLWPYLVAILLFARLAYVVGRPIASTPLSFSHGLALFTAGCGIVLVAFLGFKGLRGELSPEPILKTATEKET